MFNKDTLIRLALGDEQWRKVDLAIPQPVFDGMTQVQRADVAGWYYDESHRVFGRLLTQSECWTEIIHKLKHGMMKATFGQHPYNIGHLVVDWPCLRYHVEHNEVTLEVDNG